MFFRPDRNMLPVRVSVLNRRMLLVLRVFGSTPINSTISSYITRIAGNV